MSSKQAYKLVKLQDYKCKWSCGTPHTSKRDAQRCKIVSRKDKYKLTTIIKAQDLTMDNQNPLTASKMEELLAEHTVKKKKINARYQQKYFAKRNGKALEEKYMGQGKITAKGLRWLVNNNKICPPYELEPDMLKRLTTTGKRALNKLRGIQGRKTIGRHRRYQYGRLDTSLERDFSCRKNTVTLAGRVIRQMIFCDKTKLSELRNLDLGEI